MARWPSGNGQQLKICDSTGSPTQIPQKWEQSHPDPPEVGVSDARVQAIASQLTARAPRPLPTKSHKTNQIGAAMGDSWWRVGIWYSCCFVCSVGYRPLTQHRQLRSRSGAERRTQRNTVVCSTEMSRSRRRSATSPSLNAWRRHQRTALSRKVNGLRAPTGLLSVISDSALAGEVERRPQRSYEGPDRPRQRSAMAAEGAPGCPRGGCDAARKAPWRRAAV